MTYSAFWRPIVVIVPVTPCSRSEPPGGTTPQGDRALSTHRSPQIHCSPRNSVMHRKGFTLIELLIVIVIIGILAAIGIPKFANSKSKAYVTAMKSDLRNLVSAEESLFSDSTYYTTA